MTRMALDVPTLVYGYLGRGPARPCNIARRTGLKQSTVRSFLYRMEKVGSVMRERSLLWKLSPTEGLAA
jgi:DNA-binding IclR family transcriptional regulator